MYNVSEKGLHSCPNCKKDDVLFTESCDFDADMETLKVFMVCEECKTEVVHHSKYGYSKTTL